MSSQHERSQRPPPGVPSCIGLVVHPSRAIDEPLRAVREWADAGQVQIAQVRAPCQQQRVAEERDAEDCDLIVSIGGDGTTLAAIRAAAEAGRPTLGIAFGSLGVLTAVGADRASSALERFSRGDWVPRALPALAITREGEELFAFNDVAIVRAAGGQVLVSIEVDGLLFARLAGDGCVVSTPLGSSGYTMAAGGPLLGVQDSVFVCTPLSTHGGSCPPLVVSAGSRLQLSAPPGHDGARLEIDGQVTDTRIGSLAITLREEVATVVTFSDQEAVLNGLRRRRIIIDSPRILVEDER